MNIAAAFCSMSMQSIQIGSCRNVQTVNEIFSKPYYLNRHKRACDANVKHKLPGHTLEVNKSVFEELEVFGFQFESEDKFFPISRLRT